MLTKESARVQGGGKLDLGWLHGVACWEVHAGVPRIARGNELGANEAHWVS